MGVIIFLSSLIILPDQLCVEHVAGIDSRSCDRSCIWRHLYESRRAPLDLAKETDPCRLQGTKRGRTIRLSASSACYSVSSDLDYPPRASITWSLPRQQLYRCHYQSSQYPTVTNPKVSQPGSRAASTSSHCPPTNPHSPQLRNTSTTCFTTARKIQGLVVLYSLL